MPTNPYDTPIVTDPVAKPAPAKSLVVLALVSLHVSAALYLLAGLFLSVVLSVAAGDTDAGEASLGVILAAFCAALAAGVEVVAYGIHRRRFWGWIAGLIVFGIYIPSLFFPLGILGLVGLLASGSRREFGIAQSDNYQRERQGDHG